MLRSWSTPQSRRFRAAMARRLPLPLAPVRRLSHRAQTPPGPPPRRRAAVISLPLSLPLAAELLRCLLALAALRHRIAPSPELRPLVGRPRLVTGGLEGQLVLLPPRARQGRPGCRRWMLAMIDVMIMIRGVSRQGRVFQGAVRLEVYSGVPVPGRTRPGRSQGRHGETPAVSGTAAMVQGHLRMRRFSAAGPSQEAV